MLFVTSRGLVSRDLGLPQLRSVFNVGSGVAQGASEITANSGRWVQLTQASAELAQKYPMVVNSTTGLNTGVLRGDNGQFVALLQFTKDNGALLASLSTGGSRGPHGATRNEAVHGRDH